MSQDEKPLTTEPSLSRRRRFRFRIRSLFALTTLLALVLGWVATERRQSAFERRVGDELLKQHPMGTVTFLGPYDSLDLHNRRQPQGWWRDMARKVLGERIFRVGFPRDQASLNLLADLTNVESLTLSGMTIGDLTPLSTQEHLTTLNILDASVNDLSPLAGLSGLESIRLTRTPIEDLSALTELENLKTLELASTPVSDLTPLSGLKNLEELRLIDIPDVDLAPLVGLTSLQLLQVPGSSVSDIRPLTQLKELKYLFFTGSSFVGELLHLSGPSSLQRLLQNRPCISDEDFEHLQEALPKCRVRRSGRRAQS